MAADSAELLKGMHPDVPATVRAAYLTEAAEHLSEAALGSSRYPRAVALLAAHWLELEERAKAGLSGVGGIASQSGSTNPDGTPGSGSVSFVHPQLRMDTWGQTQWGVELSSLVRQSVGITARVAGIL